MRRTLTLPFLAALSLVVGAASSLAGCASSDSMSAASMVVPVTDVSSVAGKWAGLAEGPGSNQTDYVEMTIRDDGTYDVMTRRTMGTFNGKGKITVRGGQLVMQGDHGTGVATLLARDSERVLKVDATFQTSVKVSANLRPAR